MAKLYFFGEDHSKLKEIAKIDAKIVRLKPDYLLHELLYADLALTKEVIEQRLHHCKEGGICDPRLNKDIYELGLTHDIKLVGIDHDRSTHVGAKPTAEEQASLDSTQDVYGSKDKDSLEKPEDK